MSGSSRKRSSENGVDVTEIVLSAERLYVSKAERERQNSLSTQTYLTTASRSTTAESFSATLAHRTFGSYLSVLSSDSKI